MTSGNDIQFETQVASTTSNFTVNQFEKYHLSGSLELRPPYQRNIVWSVQQKSFLIDSILRGLPIPEIYIQSRTSASGDERITIVDGQQRISSCLAFLKDDLILAGDELVRATWKDKRFSELDESLQQRIRSYELIVRKLPDLGEPRLREIFRRLNKTVEPLLPQELRHAAYTGEFLTFVEKASSVPILGALGVFSARDYQRRRNDELMAEIAFALISNAFPNKKEGLDDLFETYENQGTPPDTVPQLGRSFGRVFCFLEEAAAQLRKTRFRNKSDFYTLFIILARNADRLPLSPAHTLKAVEVLQNFSDLVNDLKREEAAGRSIESIATKPDGAVALAYLRAVERAASDRLSRVRRSDALERMLLPLFSMSVSSEPNESDAKWLLAEESSPDDDSDFEGGQQSLGFREEN